MPEVLQPARLDFAADGTPYSALYDDVYHASAGGPGQAAHVFLHGNGLPERWRGAPRWTILETGFGTGLNFLATWAAWQADPRRPARLHYIATEKHPFQLDDLTRLHARWPEFARESAQLRRRWPTLTPGFQHLEFDAGRVVLTLLLGDARHSLARLQARVDSFYLDGFAPTRNPELWSPELCQQLARLAAPNATLATWSVAGSLRAALQAAGFAVEKVPGFGHKREMLSGRHAPPAYRPVAAAPAPPSQRRAIVIGAGLAGTACCERLAARDWEVTLIDRHGGPAEEASGNLAGIFHPLLARDDNIPARLTRSAFLHGLRRWQDLTESGHAFPWSANGLVQLARDAQHEALQRRLPGELGYPPDYARFAEADEIAALLGMPVPNGGWLIARGGWANPAGLCRAYLARAGEPVRTLYRREVAELRRVGDSWQVIANDASLIAEAPHIILACGARPAGLALPDDLSMQRIRGQVTLLAQHRLPDIALPVCREGYLTPALEGWHCLGASYDPDDAVQPRHSSTLENHARLARLAEGLSLDPEFAGNRHRVGFRAVPPDRLPLAGTLARPTPGSAASATQLRHLQRHEGLHGLLGYASRGIIWSSLMAELLVAGLEGDALPIETDLADAVDPGRLLLKRLRKNKGPD